MDISEASTTEDDLTENERNARIFARQMLKQRRFIGCFKERRFVDALNDYRDVIVVQDPLLQKDMNIVRKRLRGVYKDCWIGITMPDYIGAPYGHCLWVKTENYDSLGNYVYNIKTVKFRRDEIIVCVKNIISLDKITTQNTINESLETNISNYIQNFSWDKTLDELKKSLIEYATWFFTCVLTADNIKEAIIFLSVLFVTSITFSIKSVQFFLDFLLKFMRELSHLIQSTTPVMLSIVDLFAKIIGGFFILIYSIFRDSKRSEPIQPRQRFLPIEARQRQPLNYYRPRSSVIIQEIDD